MALVEMILPRMGESVMEATILSWLKKEGDFIQAEEPLVEVATDKVDTEVMATHSGIIQQILAKEGDVVQVGNPIVIVETETDTKKNENTITSATENTFNFAGENEIEEELIEQFEPEEMDSGVMSAAFQLLEQPKTGRFYSPLVISIAKAENISMAELELIPGSGSEGRVTKQDVLAYLHNRSGKNKVNELQKMNATVVATPTPQTNIHVKPTPEKIVTPTTDTAPKTVVSNQTQTATSISGAADIIQMDRMRKMIAERMIESQRISAHVTTFIETDVTNIVAWRSKVKHDFMQKENEPLTFTPIFIEAIAKALKEYPMLNSSVVGDTIVVKKDINIGVAVALDNGNLIVPVIKNADRYNLIGLTKQLNELVRKARMNKLSADDLSDGTYTISNVGTFGNLMGTPIIVQPQVGIMAFGTIQKKPVVVETPSGDTIGIRQMIFLSHSYDHRIIDGALGGRFVHRVGELLQEFDTKRKLW
jgi:2-oxoglutarate dehydrogenase E2 component (dihydrolipoamide succinyltransferase)